MVPSRSTMSIKEHIKIPGADILQPFMPDLSFNNALFKQIEEIEIEANDDKAISGIDKKYALSVLGLIGHQLEEDTRQWFFELLESDQLIRKKNQMLQHTIDHIIAEANTQITEAIEAANILMNFIFKQGNTHHNQSICLKIFDDWISQKILFEFEAF